ncbi:hypothetical protein E4U44_003247 [Claviceps purpurea]|nr:hypothetical protein E4U44_003247 [Claviceps purpurea]
MPTSVNMGASIAQENSRKSLCQKSPKAGSSISRTSGPCFSKSNINDSERTLVDAMETGNKPACGPDGQRQRQLSSFSASSDKGQAQSMDDNRTKYQGSIKRRVDYCVVEDDQVAVELGNYTGVWAGDTGESVPQVRSRYFGDHIHQNAYHRHQHKS